MNRNTFARLVLLIGALAVLLVLQGCGGGDGVSQSLHDSVSTDLGAAETARDTYKDRVAELEGTIGDMVDPAADSLRGMLAQASTDLEAAKKALKDATGDLATERDEVKRLKDVMKDLEDERDALEDERDKYKKMVGDGEKEDDDEETRAYMVKRAKSIMAAMNANSTAPTVEVEWDDAAAAAKVTVKDKDDYDAGDAPPAISGWTNVTLTQDRALPVGGTDSVYVYTDISGPEATKFKVAHGDDKGLVTFGTGADGNAKLAMADRFPDSDGGSYNHWDSVSTPMAVRSAIPGTYDGVPGRFECAATASSDCTIGGMDDADGNLVLSFGGSRRLGRSSPPTRITP